VQVRRTGRASLYEPHHAPLLPMRAFVARLGVHAIAGVVLATVSLAIGMVGYRLTESLGWVDAFLNASMLLGGMGPVNVPVTTAGKVFAGGYALYCGFVLLVVVGILLAPVAHRILHRFHLSDDDEEGDQGDGSGSASSHRPSSSVTP
jgi:hypothetical protein